jgi:2-dehydro-3-deoxyphosphogluconate aldolase/(4S)-4-hydroxy-2-oxoglutarate aldolase
MPIHNIETMIAKIRRAGIIPVFYHEDPEITCNVIGACYEGGVRVFTFASHGARAQESYLMLKKYAQRHLPEMYLGFGGVRDRETAETFISFSADFLQSPLTDPATGAACREAGTLWIPACLSEADMALAAAGGAGAVQLMAGHAGTAGLLTEAATYPSLVVVPRGSAGPGPASVVPWLEKGGPVFIDEGLITPAVLAGRYGQLREETKKLLKQAGQS